MTIQAVRSSYAIRFSSINELIMRMNKRDLEDQKSTSNNSIIERDDFLPEITKYPRSSSENSPTSNDDIDIIAFGPIKVKPRKKPAPTLATGRRSKYEMLSPEEEQKRDVRRARNRAAAERVRINRLNVEQELQGQINALQEQEHRLLTQVQTLRNQKLQLEARLNTHGKICSPVPLLTPQTDLMSAFSSNNSSTFQQNDQVDFDDILANSSPIVQNQQNNYADLVNDDFDDLFLNP